MNKISNNLMRFSIVFLLLFLIGWDNWSFCASVPDSSLFREKLVFHFSLNSSILKRDYKKNNAELERLRILLSPENLSRIERIVVIGDTSPEGNNFGNIELSGKRAKETRMVIEWKHPEVYKKYGIRIELISVAEDNSLKNLREAVAKVSYLPYYDKLLKILDMDNSVNEKIVYIKNECGDDAYKYIVTESFGPLRNATVYIRYLCDKVIDMESSTASLDLPKVVNVPKEEIVVPQSDIVEPLDNEKQEIQTKQPITEIIPKYNIQEAPLFHRLDPKRVVFALKTNLLFDLMTAANIEIEIPIGNRWSIAAGAVFPNWHFNNHYSMIMNELSLETRMWLGNSENLQSGKKRNSLTGHFVGIYGNWVKNYDLQWQHKGVMGDGYGLGVTYGFAHRLGRNFNMEYSVGIGALYLNNKNYGVNDNYKFKELKSEFRRWHFMPTRAKISLVWLIGSKDSNNKKLF